jgi:hypothetical protein
VKTALLLLITLCPALAAAQAPGPSPFDLTPEAEASLVEELSTRPPRRVEQVGSTSITLRLDLGTDLDGAYRPRTRTHPRGYLAEIAAYRIAVALGMNNVPPVIGRSIPRQTLLMRFQEDEAEWTRVDEATLWDAPGLARGAVVYWVPRMRTSDLHTVSALDRAGPWLRTDGELPEEQAQRARDLSTMIAFDYLIANWDRWSGGNVSENEAGTRLIVRDHNVAFLAPIGEARYERMRQALTRVQRFSRSFVERLTALDEATLRESLATDPEASVGVILSDPQIAEVLARRRALLSYIGALIAVYGEAQVLAWP